MAILVIRKNGLLNGHVPTGRDVCGCADEGDVRRIVEVELHDVGRPNDSVSMEGGVYALTVGKIKS